MHTSFWNFGRFFPLSSFRVSMHRYHKCSDMPNRSRHFPAVRKNCQWAHQARMRTHPGQRNRPAASQLWLIRPVPANHAMPRIHSQAAFSTLATQAEGGRALRHQQSPVHERARSEYAPLCGDGDGLGPDDFYHGGMTEQAAQSAGASRVTRQFVRARFRAMRGALAARIESGQRAGRIAAGYFPLEGF